MVGGSLGLGPHRLGIELRRRGPVALPRRAEGPVGWILSRPRPFAFVRPVNEDLDDAQRGPRPLEEETQVLARLSPQGNHQERLPRRPRCPVHPLQAMSSGSLRHHPAVELGQPGDRPRRRLHVDGENEGVQATRSGELQIETGSRV